MIKPKWPHLCRASIPTIQLISFRKKREVPLLLVIDIMAEFPPRILKNTLKINSKRWATRNQVQKFLIKAKAYRNLLITKKRFLNCRYGSIGRSSVTILLSRNDKEMSPLSLCLLSKIESATTWKSRGLILWRHRKQYHKI